MIRKWVAANGIALLAVALLFMPDRPVTAFAQQDQKVDYTMAEYNAVHAGQAETNPAARVRLLDDFVAKFPNSTLLPFAYQLYFDAYNQQKNYPKVVEYADKLLAMGDKVAIDARINTAYTRSLVAEFAYNPRDPNAKDALARTRDAAALGLKLLDQWQKPATLPDDQYAQQKKIAATTFNNSAGFAALQQKDYKAASDSYKASIALKNDDPITYYRLGAAELLMNPPQSMDGLWALARAVALKGPVEAQARAYLKKQLTAYQQPGCDSLIDPQMSELIQLATTSPDRPASYTIPNQADLDKVRQSSTILTVLTDLKAGGDKAKVTWLALCGSEFPEVVGKVIEVTPGDDGVTFKVYTGSTADEMQAATTANMEVKVTGQPEAARLEKEDGIKFSGTLESYDPDPAFLLHWDKAKVDPEVIPAEKAAPGSKRPAKRPAKKSSH